MGDMKKAQCNTMALYQEQHSQRSSSDQLPEATINHQNACLDCNSILCVSSFTQVLGLDSLKLDLQDDNKVFMLGVL